MKNKQTEASTNKFWIIAGIINFLIFLLHLIGGQIELVNALLETNLGAEIKSQWVGAWHMVSIIILATSIVLLMAGFNKKFTKNLDLVKFTGYLNLAFCLPFLIAGFYYQMLVPQWIFFLPVAVLTFWGVKKVEKTS